MQPHSCASSDDDQATTPDGVCGRHPEFEAVVEAQEPLAYSWTLNGTQLDDTDAKPQLHRIAPSQAGVISAVVSNQFGIVTNWANLEVDR
jgi:hypothetical protein